jgi:putative transcriptional regulator
MNKTALREQTKLSSGTMAKLSRNENITTDVLARICNVLHCDIADIVEVIEE